MRQIYDKRKIELAVKVIEKEKLIDDKKQKIAKMKIKCLEGLHMITNTSEYQIEKRILTNEDEVSILSEEAKLVTQQYHTLLDLHLANEKGMRVRRYKLETVFANWLAKYDADIGELQKEFDILTEGYDGEKAVYDELKERYDEQDIQYVELMKEKEEDERQIFEKKCYEFLLQRSARRIQRWWRRILERRRARRRRKRKAKKKKK